MSNQELKQKIDQLKGSKSEEDRKACIPLLKEFLEMNPNDPVTWYDLAGCFDFCGLEKDAEPCYRKTYELGWQLLPKSEQAGFFVGFGSTLRNNLKFSESENILADAVANFPNYPALKCFLAFTLYSNGKFQEASKTLFLSTLEMPEKTFAGYEGAIKWYVENLSSHPPVTKLNSIIFHTSNLTSLRDFYENHFGLKVGTFEKNGQPVPDCSESYVNYQMNGMLLCFEQEDGRCDLGTVVLNVESLPEFKERLTTSKIPVSGDVNKWLKVKDPDGRTIILEAEWSKR